MGDLLSWIVVALVIGFPAWRILSRAGLSRAWVLLVLLSAPGFAIFFGVLAFKEWPAAKDQNPAAGGG